MFTPNADAIAIYYCCKANKDFSKTGVEGALAQVFNDLGYQDVLPPEQCAILVAWVEKRAQEKGDL